MALTVPTAQALADFKGETLEELGDLDIVAVHLQAATDLMEIATGLSLSPALGTLERRVLDRGILDMAWFVGTSMEDRDAQFSPFSSERIGSYSYSKAQKSITLGQITGVPFFDVAVAYFSDLLLAGGEVAWSSSTYIMPGTLDAYINPNEAEYEAALDFYGR